MNSNNIKVNEALRAYFEEHPQYCEPYGNGHINDTFLVTAERRYILQRMNTDIFTHPEELMKNIIGVTEHIRNKTKSVGGDVERASLTFVPTKSGDVIFRDSDGCCWRMCIFVERSVTRERVERVDDFRSCGEAFGSFCQLLSDYPAHKLYESIENFHNTLWRYENLMKAVMEDRCGRLAEVESEVSFVRNREELCKTLERAHQTGELPLRVTHNDTKLNNILFDEQTGKPVCVIDLDTVMSGYSVNDFGDSIRFGANTAAEDETVLSKVSLDLELFEAYAKGFLKGCNGSLMPSEIDLLPIGAILMTLECGMRFLTDYLEGDVYFKTHRPKHNLDRARNQLALVADMESKLDDMKNIIKNIQSKE